MTQITEERQLVDSAEVNFGCPHCEQSNETDALRIRTIEKLFGLITIRVTHETVVKCPDCGTTFTTKISPDELRALPDDQLSQIFHVRVSFIAKFLVLTGAILCCSGPISLAILFIAWLMLPRAARKWRRALYLGAILPAIATIWIAISMWLEFK